MSIRQMVLSVVTAILVIGTLVTIPRLFENLDAHEVMVIQSPYSGNLSVYTTPGVKWQGMGSVTKYPRRAQYDFGSKDSKGNQDSLAAKRIRFNDGGHAFLFGAVSWEMPLSDSSILAIQRTYGSVDAVVNQGVAKMVDQAILLSGPLMSSTESSGERRAELTQFINDQAQNGVYQTITKQVDLPDPITGEKKPTAQVEIVRDQSGNPLRQAPSILKQFDITLLPIAIQDIQYDSVVEKQIAERQKATMQVQIAVANAKKAEQDAITTAKQGEAVAAQAKWEQEALKAKAVTEAQQNYEVAKLRALEAEQYKKEQILRGEGEGERRRLVMSADGALDSKLKTYENVQKMWADAFAKYNGQMVPGVVFGGSSTSSLNGMQNFVELMTVKAARDLGMDLEVAGKNNTAKKVN